MTTTPVSICSNALLMVGDRPISSFTEANSDRARLVANLWESTRDYVLRKHPWNCATKRVVLSPESTAPAFDYAYQFLLPGDWLRTLSVGYPGERECFKMEGGKILMDSNVCRLRYIWRNDNPATWDATLIFAMTRVMAALVAYPITQSGTTEQLIEVTLREVLREARAIDGQEDINDALDDSPLMDARTSYGNFGVSRYREP